MLRTVLPLLVASGVAVPTAAQASLAPGFDSQLSLHEHNAWLFTGFAVGNGGDLYVAVGDDVERVDPFGNRTSVHRFSQGAGVSLLERPPGTDVLWFVEAGTTRLWRYDIVTGTTTVGSVPAWAFDLAIAPDGTVLVSADPGWPLPSGSGGIWAVDFVGGAHRQIVRVPGPSGPLAFDATGNLDYAIQNATYPTPPGSVRIVRFDAARVQAALAGGASLDESDASTTLNGLDGAFDLEFDDAGRLYWSDPQQGSIERTVPGALVRDPQPLVEVPPPPSFSVALGLAFVDAGPATFEAFQPTGATLYAQVTDWAQQADVIRIEPTRPVMLSSPTAIAPAGPVTLVARGLPPGQPAWICASSLPPVPERVLLTIHGTPLWSGLNLGVTPLFLGGIADATGELRWSAYHAGGYGAVVQMQTIGLATGTLGPLPAASAIYSLTLLP